MKKEYGVLGVMSLVLALILGIMSHAFAEDLISPTATVVDQYTLKGEKHYFTGYDAGDAEGNINAVIEIPKGTTGKWEVDPKAGTIIWEFKKGKPREVTYMGGYIVNYGSIPQTSMPKKFGGDGESVDIVVLGAALPRGEVVKVTVIGILNLIEPGGYDGKILAVKKGSPEDGGFSIEELNAKFDNVVAKTSSWFENYKGPNKGLKVESIGSVDDAMEILLASMEAYSEQVK